MDWMDEWMNETRCIITMRAYILVVIIAIIRKFFSG